MLEARQHTRAPVALTPRYRPATAVDFTEVKCHDLSVGGMFLEADRTIEPGTLVKVQCDLPAGAISGLGVVVWRRDASCERGPAGVGVRFMRLADGGPELIEAFVSERVPSMPPAAAVQSAADASPASDVETPAPKAADDDSVEDGALPLRRGGRALAVGAALLLAAVLVWALR